MGAISFSLDGDLLDELLRLMPMELFVESGTFHGESLLVAQPRFRQCISIELSPKHHAAAQGRFASLPGVELICGDSARVIEDLRPRFAGTPTFFWLDAHWCAAENTAGERSQCPLLGELAAIGRLDEASAIAIDDARFFLSPPPLPHEISDWPTLDEVLHGLQRLSDRHSIVCFNDVILFLPRTKQAAILPYLRRRGFNLLSYTDKARGYDVLLEQTKRKEAELAKQAAIAKDRENSLILSAGEADRLRAEAAKLTAALTEKESSLLAAHTEREEVEAASHERESALAQSNAEADRLRANAAKLTADLKIKEAALLAAHGEIQQLAATSKARESSLAQSNAEADRLRANAAGLTADLKNKETALLAAHKEREQLALTSNQRESLLAQSSAEADRLRHDAHQRLQLVQTAELKIKQLESDLAATRSQLENANSGLVAKEAVIQNLLQTCDERLKLINQLALKGERPVVNTTKVVTYHMQGAYARFRRAARLRVQAWLLKQTQHQIANLAQHPPRPFRPEKFPFGRNPAQWPRINIITPSYNQGHFLRRTMLSVLDQKYPNLAYGVQDGGSTDDSAAIITEYIGQLRHAESARDDGQADAIQKGFKKLYPEANSVMAWLNSDDTLMPGSLKYVGRYFATHPEVDVIYGHRVIIDEQDQEVGRWFLPRHHADTLPWFDLVPQETLFWRTRCFEQIGGMDPSFHFAMDWDLLLRFEQAGFNIRRVPYFLGCFRVHTQQKTSTRIQTLGEEEMKRLRLRTHQREVAHWEIHRQLDNEIGRSALVAWRHKFGLR